MAIDGVLVVLVLVLGPVRPMKGNAIGGCISLGYGETDPLQHPSSFP